MIPRCYTAGLGGAFGMSQVIVENDHVSLIAGTIDGEEFSMLEIARFLREVRNQGGVVRRVKS